jgi:protein SCO1/2
VVLPLVAGIGLLGPQTAQAAIGDSGGIVATASTPAPDFTLTDQNGQSLAVHDLRGKLFLIVFLDPECYDSCPLMANQLATSVRALGPSASSVAILAVDVNPVFNRVQDTATFTREHGLSDLPSWHFVTGSLAEVGSVLTSYGQGVSVPAVGMIGHPQTVYLFGRDGNELAELDDTANDDLTSSYVQLITAELRRHL